MSKLVSAESHSYPDENDARFHYAKLRSVGVPHKYLKFSDDADGATRLTLLREPDEARPAGIPEFKEHREGKEAAFDAVIRGLGKAITKLTGWKHHFEVRYSGDAQDFVLALDVAPRRNDPDEDIKIDALDDLFKGIFKDTRVQSNFNELEFDGGHPLRGLNDTGMSFELPLSPALLGVGRCNTVDKFSEGPESGGRRQFGGR